ncbi:SCAN domain-containing protein 3-like [Diabrotica undecimpunctata]|uniref:SCAN domain-containing protein 3-like n=1 Tax=Diabrotica undecimpunctata TaxID=50387 RepID=UPI003B64162E
MIACATDGAEAMTGRHRGFIAHLKQAVPGILCVYCVIHREHLAAKNLSGRLHDSLPLVIDARRDLTKFPNLKSSCVDSEDLETYCLHLQTLKEDLQSPFQDLTSLKVPTWFINPFSVEVSTVCRSLQENLIDLRHDVEIQSLFGECGTKDFGRG